MKSIKGFTLVEVIVVSTIVAILALSMVQIYVGYVQDSQKQVVQNSTVAAATYLNARVNLVDRVDDLVNPLEGDNEWSTPSSGGETPSIFRAPAGVVITIDNSAGTVSATLAGHSSTPVQFR